MGAEQVFKKNATKAGPSALKILKNTDNLIHFFGEKVGKQIAFEWSPCCGLCRKRAYFVDGNGQPTTVTYPTEGPSTSVVNNAEELGTDITTVLGAGFIAYVDRPGNATIIGTVATRESGDCDDIDSNAGIAFDEHGGVAITVGVA